jgi:hypothetical protein
MEDVSTFYGHMAYLGPFDICITWPFGICVVIWYIFPLVDILYEEKSGNPGRTMSSSTQEWCHDLLPTSKLLDHSTLKNHLPVRSGIVVHMYIRQN